MDFFQRFFCAFSGALFLVPLSATAQSHQLKLIMGLNHAYHDTSHLQIGEPVLETDSLHETDSGIDFIGGLGYAYDILPWFVNDANLAKVWVGLDLILFNTTQSGEVYVDGNPDFSNYFYDLSEDTLRLMVNSEVDFKTPIKTLTPFVQASVGAARIVAHYQDETNPSVPFIREGGIDLEDKTNYNLAYSLGTGLKFLPMPEIQMSISYLYTDLGFVKTSTKDRDLTLSEPLEDHLKTSSLLFNIIYLF